jgi:tRNA(adenine34) deaminase
MVARIMLTPPTPDFLNSLMDEALHEAKHAADAGEVPVGAVISHAGTIIGRGHNQTEALSTVSAHAEIIAINQASQNLGGWRLSECILCVTLEPCTMCLGAIRLARIPTLVFGAGDSRQGATGSLYDLSQDARLGDPIRVIRNIKQTECEEILSQFFKRLRVS